MTKILLIDDSSLFRDAISSLLEAENYQVIEANNGLAGLKLARNEDPDLILCDVVMPGLTGYEVLRALRFSPKTSAIPLVLLSGLASQEETAQATMSGANGYLTKPFTMTELLDTVSTSLIDLN